MSAVPLAERYAMVATVQAAKQVKMKQPPENSSARAARTGRGHDEVRARREQA
jgi:hypothetical protein